MPLPGAPKVDTLIEGEGWGTAIAGVEAYFFVTLRDANLNHRSWRICWGVCAPNSL